MTVIADSFEGTPLNSPNDVVVHPDRSIWFTDPPYGVRGDYEGFRAEAELPLSVYRVDGQTGGITRVTDDIGAPNGISSRPTTSGCTWPTPAAGAKSGSGTSTGKPCATGGATCSSRCPAIRTPSRAPTACAATSTATSGPARGPACRSWRRTATTIGVIRLPEVCANVCFGGAKRNRLFMTASQSLYSVYVGVRGAGIA